MLNNSPWSHSPSVGLFPFKHEINFKSSVPMKRFNDCLSFVSPARCLHTDRAVRADAVQPKDAHFSQYGSFSFHVIRWQKVRPIKQPWSKASLIQLCYLLLFGNSSNYPTAQRLSPTVPYSYKLRAAVLFWLLCQHPMWRQARRWGQRLQCPLLLIFVSVTLTVMMSYKQDLQ